MQKDKEKEEIQIESLRQEIRNYLDGNIEDVKHNINRIFRKALGVQYPQSIDIEETVIDLLTYLQKHPLQRISVENMMEVMKTQLPNIWGKILLGTNEIFEIIEDPLVQTEERDAREEEKANLDAEKEAKKLQDTVRDTVRDKWAKRSF